MHSKICIKLKLLLHICWWSTSVFGLFGLDEHSYSQAIDKTVWPVVIMVRSLWGPNISILCTNYGCILVQIYNWSILSENLTNLIITVTTNLRAWHIDPGTLRLHQIPVLARWCKMPCLYLKNIGIAILKELLHIPYYSGFDWPVSLPRVQWAERSAARGPLIGHQLDTGWQGRLVLDSSLVSDSQCTFEGGLLIKLLSHLSSNTNTAKQAPSMFFSHCSVHLVTSHTTIVSLCPYLSI